ncbi:MAG: creatininase family protein [Acidimicrobiia bacterium]|nr:creatininase family protein [Acidimicrobiia bacterium]
MRRIGELRAPEVGERISEGSVVIQPVGAIEQHGLHLPLNTDLVVPTRTADALVERHGDDLDLWLLPPLAVTRSNEHAWAPGTLWLSARTLLSVVEDIGRSVAALPARRLVFLNGHGGNSALLNAACREIRLATGLMTFLAHPMVPPDQGGESAESERGMGIHGGYLETSLMLHLAPELVRMDLAEPNVPQIDNRHVRFGGPVTFGWMSDDFGGDGQIGDPTGASAEAGRSIFERTVSMLAEAMAEVRDFSF